MPDQPPLALLGYPERRAVIARCIPAGSSVLDLGAGACTLRESLIAPAPYTAVDRVPYPGCIVADLNEGYPALPRHDVVVAQGLLERLHDLPGFFRAVQAYSDRLIFTYCDSRSTDWVAQRDYAAVRTAAEVRWKIAQEFDLGAQRVFYAYQDSIVSSSS